MNSFVRIPLSNSSDYAIVSADDAGFVMFWSWHVSSEGYAMRTITVNGESHAVYLHRALMTAPPGIIVDHANGNRLDNRRENLRFALPDENVRNSRRRRTRRFSIPFKGVYKNYNCSTFVAKATYMEDGKQRHIHLGSFRTQEEAAAAWDAWAIRHHGEFAALNFPENMVATQGLEPRTP